MSAISTIVLAGGKSTRMGRDKAFLPLGEKTFLEHILAAAKPLSTQVFLSGNDARLTDFGFPIINDVQPNQGPVVAMASCFIHIKTDLVFVLSCDVPQLQTADLKQLLAAHNPEADVTLFTVEGRAMPLVALYAKSSFVAFQNTLKSGERKLFAVLEKLHVQHIPFTRNERLMNVNTEEDLKLIAQRKMEKAPSCTEKKTL